MAVSILTFYGGSVDSGQSSSIAPRRSGQRFIRAEPSFGPATVTLPKRESINGSGLMYFVMNAGSENITIEDDLADPKGTVSPNRMAFVFYIHSLETDAGDWIVVGSGNFTEGDQDNGDLSLKYGTVAEPQGSRINLGTATTVPETFADINLGGVILAFGGLTWL